MGISKHVGKGRKLFSQTDEAGGIVKEVDNINPYLVPGINVIVKQVSTPVSFQSEMSFGNMPNDGGYLLLDKNETEEAIQTHKVQPKFIKKFYGSQEFIRGASRYCIWIRDEPLYRDQSLRIGLLDGTLSGINFFAERVLPLSVTK